MKLVNSGILIKMVALAALGSVAVGLWFVLLLFMAANRFDLQISLKAYQLCFGAGLVVTLGLLGFSVRHHSKKAARYNTSAEGIRIEEATRVFDRKPD